MGREDGELVETDGLAPPSLPDRFSGFWKRLIIEPLRRVEEESRAYRASAPSRRPDWKVMVVLVTVAVCLTLQHYLGPSDASGKVTWLLEQLHFNQLAADYSAAMTNRESGQVNRLTYWAVWCVVTYVVIPALVIKLIFRERIRDYGTKFRGAFTDFWIYGVMFAIVLPLVLIVSNNERFQQTYPFYRLSPGEPLWPYFWRWEFVYMIQFFALEFFFRGFIVHGTRRRFGCYSIFVMMVPYCMIHFGKPMPETFAAIVAGIALGFMSLKNRSIWMGAVIHVTVALSMDLVSLWRKGLFY